MLWGKWDEQCESVEETIRDGETFFDIAIERPDRRKTYRWISRYAPEEQTLYLNPLLSRYTTHESRHVVHYQVITDVVERNENDIKTYYEEELSDLSSVPSGTGFTFAGQKLNNLFGIETTTDEFYDAARTADLGMDDLALQVHGQNRRTNPVQEEFYAENRTGSELSLNAVMAPTGILVSGAGATELYHAGIDALLHSPQMALPPLAILASYRAIHHMQQGQRSEPLIDTTLEAYNTDDRKRAMLYNSEVADTVDDFLDVLDEYGIE